jgi:hypothetical protein
MSYKLNILSGNPISYYTLNGTLYDELNSSASATATNYSFTTPPVITNSGSAFKNLFTTSISFPNNNLEALSKNFEDKTFTVAFWFSLNNQLTGSGYGTNPINTTNNKLDLFHVNSTTPKIFTVYYDYFSNTIRLKVAGSGNTEAYIPLRDMNTAYYVVATYYNKKLSIVVNGEQGVPGYVYDTSIITNYDKSTLYYSLGSSIGYNLQVNHFLISDIAMYNRQLNIREINQHLSWAFNDAKPTSYSKQSSEISFVNIKASENSLNYVSNISGKDFNAKGIYRNLNIDNFGLSPKKIDRSSWVTYSGSPTITTSSSNGISWSGYGGIKLNNIYPQFNLPIFMINLQIKRSSVQQENIFSFEIFNDNSYIYLSTSSSNYSLNYFNPKTNLSKVIFSTASAPSSGSANIALVFDTGTIYLYTSDAGSAVYDRSSDITLKNIKFTKSTNIVIGNFSASPSTFSSSVKNVGMSETTTYNFNSFNWSKPVTLMTKLTNTEDPYVVSQYGYWQTSVPVTRINNSFISQVDWKTMDNCIVSTSTDNGSSFFVINKNSPIKNYNLSNIPKDAIVKVELYTDYYVENKTQSFNNLSISIVDTVQTKTDLNYYNLKPIITSSATSPSFKNGSIPIISNPSNFGIKFSGASAQPPAYLSASTQFGTFGGIDFWFRNDNLSGSAIIISSGSSINVEPFAYISNSGYLVHNASVAYVNGASVVSGSAKIDSGTPYHIAVVPSASVSASSFYMNGHPNTASINTSCATYGMINIWTNQPSSSVISSVYNAYAGRITQTVIDDNTTKIVPNLASDSVFAYKIG